MKKINNTKWSFDSTFTNAQRFNIDLSSLLFKKPKWYIHLWDKIKRLFRRKTNFEKYLRNNEINFIYELDTRVVIKP